MTREQAEFIVRVLIHSRDWVRDDPDYALEDDAQADIAARYAAKKQTRNAEGLLLDFMTAKEQACTDWLLDYLDDGKLQ